jgi:hypothetical protein
MTEESEPGPDPQLRRLFCDTDARDTGELPDAGNAAFTAHVAALVRRRRRWRRIGAMAAALIAVGGMVAVAAWTAPLLTRASIGLAHYGNGLQQLAGWFAKPAGWACSLALALLVLWRTRAFRR